MNTLYLSLDLYLKYSIVLHMQTVKNIFTKTARITDDQFWFDRESYCNGMLQSRMKKYKFPGNLSNNS